MLTRREALARLVAITGASIIGADYWLTGCARSDKVAQPFSAAEQRLMDAIAETIIPETDTPGARTAGVGPFMAMMVHDCYDSDSHATFQNGLSTIDRTAQTRFGKPFVECAPPDRTALLDAIDRDRASPQYFRMLKELTLLGFFSSEVGCTRALRYVESPGRYDGDVPYRKGDHAWAIATRRG